MQYMHYAIVRVCNDVIIKCTVCIQNLETQCSYYAGKTRPTVTICSCLVASLPPPPRAGIKLEMFSEAVADCSAVLHMEPDNIKG